MEKQLINFCVNHLGHSHELVDALYGYYQSLSPSNESWVDFQISDSFDPSADLNIYLDYMTDQDLDLSAFDAVIYSNGCEPLIVGTQTIATSLKNTDYFLSCNSYLAKDHPMTDQVIWFPANILVLRDLWCRHFTSIFYQTHQMKSSITRDQGLIFINGRLESWRHHLALKIQQSCPEILQRSVISKSVGETCDSFFESIEDSKFRDAVNDLYVQDIIRNQPRSTTSIVCGIDGKFGDWPLSYSFIPEFFQFRCVIFPESTWQNDELAVTEKALKCFYSGCFPWPIGGSNINRLYNETGFYTAWNLLPEELRTFDSEKDHMLRYDLMMESISWLSKNQEVMVDSKAQEMLQSNLIHFLTCSPEIDAVKKFDLIIRKLLEKSNERRY